MTPAQRKKHIKDINSLLTETWGTVDPWGHYKYGDYRVKMQKSSLRLEKKSYKRWFRCSSLYFKDVNLETFKTQLIGIRERA